MGQTNVVPVAIPYDSGSENVAIAGGTAINASNTMLIPNVKEGKLIILVNNTYAGAKKVTVKAGYGIESVLGDQEVSVAQNEVKALFVTSSKFKNASGKVELAFEAGMTGFVRALTLPFVA